MVGRLVLVVAVLLSVGCGKKAVPDVDLTAEQPRVVLFPDQHEAAEVRGAVISAMTSRGWVTEQENGNELVARLSHKGATVRVSIMHAADKVTIKGLMAEGAGRNYERWVANLESSIRDTLKRPAAPAAPPPPAPPAVTPSPTLAVFEAKQKPENLKGVLQRALAAHSWVIEQEEAGGALVARLNHRKGMVRVRIVADPTQASITYVDSQELSFDGGGRNAEYEKWMRNLVDSIRAATRS